jgi:hypothetical protein
MADAKDLKILNISLGKSFAIIATHIESISYSTLVSGTLRQFSENWNQIGTTWGDS